MISAKEAFTQAAVDWDRKKQIDEQQRREREESQTPIQLGIIERQVLAAVESGMPSVRFYTDWELTRTAYEFLVELGYRVDTSWDARKSNWVCEISWYIKEPA